MALDVASVYVTDRMFRPGEESTLPQSRLARNFSRSGRQLAPHDKLSGTTTREHDKMSLAPAQAEFPPNGEVRLVLSSYALGIFDAPVHR